MADYQKLDDEDEPSWVETGLRVWNGTIMVLALIFCVEATIFFWLGAHSPDLQFAAENSTATNGGWNVTVTTVSQGKLEMGMGFALTIVASGMIILAASQCMECCFEKKFMRIVYTLFCCILIVYELILVYVIVAIENWDIFKANINGVEISKISATLKDCMWLLVPELVISVFMQIGAMVFHCAWREQLRLVRMEGAAGGDGKWCFGLCGDNEDKPGARYQKLFKTFSGGKNEVTLSDKHVKRLESMRSYYAQLYMENGLEIPNELAEEDEVKRRDYKQRTKGSR